MVRARSACPPQFRPMETLLGDVESLASALGLDLPMAIQLLLIHKLDQVRQAVIAPPRVAGQAKEGLIIAVTVVTAGTPVQGPNIQVPPGYATVVRQRRHEGTPRTGYWAFERSDTANALNRSVFKDNDSISLRLSRWDSLWFDANQNDTSFELIVEYGRARESS
mgnify:FL=1